MAPAGTPFSGSEYVLVAQVPRGGKGKPRWKQTHFNRPSTETFFRVKEKVQDTVRLERVSTDGCLHSIVERRLVYSTVNKNLKIEFDYGDIKEYPTEGPPILVIVEIDVRFFRYMALLPGDAGYEQTRQLSESREKLGKGHPRVRVTLDDVEMVWPECPLRDPKEC